MQPEVLDIEGERLVSVKTAGTILDVSRMTIYRLIDSGSLLGVRVNKQRKIPLKNIREYMQSIEDLARAEVAQ